ncbi:MAG TPA: hypothetical protein VHC19_23905 [Pirellulales bacterium]|nr:hypothetical protein [Pirellulales bacterium]
MAASARRGKSKCKTQNAKVKLAENGLLIVRFASLAADKSLSGPALRPKEAPSGVFGEALHGQTTANHYHGRATRVAAPAGCG